jgi:hypothetical protein
MWQSLVADYQVIDRAMLVKDVPQDKWEDYDFLISMLDWNANVDPNFAANHFTEPKPIEKGKDSKDSGYQEQWIVYGSDYYSAKELTVLPGRTVKVKDAAAYGTITLQGYGRFGKHSVSAPSMIRYGEMTEDEFFVSAEAAGSGVEISNQSSSEPLVMLKHFNPGNPDMPRRAAK